MKNSKNIYASASENETFEIAKRLAESFQGKEVVFLMGELGAGKTVFAKGIAAGLGLEDVNQVSSPSFTLVNIPQAKYPVFHIDLYRLGKNSEIEDLGWEDYLSLQNDPDLEPIRSHSSYAELADEIRRRVSNEPGE